MTRSRIAAKYVNLVDRVVDEDKTLIPSGFGIERVDRPDPDPIYARVKRPSNAWMRFDDRTLADLIGLV